MTISRRSFARSILAAVAGAAVLRQAVAAPVKEQIAEAFGVPVESVPEGPRAIAEKSAAFDHEAFKAASIQPRRIAVRCNVSRKILEDHPCSMSTLVQCRLAAAMAKAVSEQWGKGVEYTVSTLWNDDLAKPEVTCTQIAIEDKSHIIRRAEWLRRRALGEWDGTMALPDGWEMRQYGPYKAADGQPAVDPKEWHAFARPI